MRAPVEGWERWLAAWEARGLARRPRSLSTGAGPVVERDGRRLIHMASNNYLGLATDPRVVAAARRALEGWGAGAGAAPLVAGHGEWHARLEAELADYKGTEAALVFASGYAANVGVLAALAGPRDTIFADALVHASLVDGARASGARLRFYRHGDPDHLEAMLRRSAGRGRRLVVTDGVFSMDGDLAPLPALVELAERYDALLVVDDAHGTGVVGPEGRGTVHRFGLAGRVPVQVGTLSKALGAQGGFVAGSRRLIRWLWHRARAWVYSTALAPVLAAAALEALRLARAEDWRRQRLRRHGARLRSGLRSLGYRVLGDAEAPMTAVVVGEPEAAAALAARLEEQGVLAPAIRPPTVPAGTSRIRLAPMATHTDDQIEHVLAAFRAAGVPGG